MFLFFNEIESITLELKKLVRRLCLYPIHKQQFNKNKTSKRKQIRLKLCRVIKPILSPLRCYIKVHLDVYEKVYLDLCTVDLINHELVQYNECDFCVRIE